MAGYAYQTDDELDRRHDDQQHDDQPSGSSTHAAAFSMAEIHQFFADDDAPASAPAGHRPGPDVDMLAMHGAAPELAHVDPAVAAVAQAELETKPGAPAPAQAQDSEAADAPQSATMAHSAPAEDNAPAHEGLPSHTVFASAAQGLTAASDATAGGPPASLGKHNVMGGAGGGGGEEVAASPVADATATSAPAAPPPAAPEAQPASSWEDQARGYNQSHGHVEQFNAATGNACGTGAEADPRAVAAWQTAHGVHPDGRIGPLTLHAATKVATAKHLEPEADTGAAKPAETHATKPAAPAAPVVEAHAEVKPQAPAPIVAKPQPAITPIALAAPQQGAADSFVGTEDTKGKEKDRWTSYGKGDKKTYGWDLGGTHGAKHSGGDTSAAIYAVSNVEGRYDSVQTYDAGILSFGIMQWTLHAGSLQKFLGFLKDKSGPEGRAAFQDDFVAQGIDVKPTGGQYQLVYNGKEYPLGSHGAGKAAIDKLVREDKASARKWSEVFHAAGADPRVQKAQFERAKDMFRETQGVTFGDKIVDQSLEACPNTFHAKHRDQYGKAEGWMSASPKAAALFFSMRVNNPKYANAAFLKAIDAFYDANGTDRAKWPKNWGDSFGDLVAA